MLIGVKAGALVTHLSWPLPLLARLAGAYGVALLAQAHQVHLGLESHQERAVVGDLQVKPQACGRRRVASGHGYSKGPRLPATPCRPAQGTLLYCRNSSHLADK